MLDPRAKFCFKVFEVGLPLEGFVVTEEADDDVGLEPGEPFVGGGHGTDAGMT